MKYVEVRMNKSFDVIKIIKTDLEICAESPIEYVVKEFSDAKFRIIDKHKVKKNYTQFNSVIEDCAVSDYSRDSFWSSTWGDFIIRLYTAEQDEVKIGKKMTKEFNKWLDKKKSEYAYYFSSDSRNVKINL